MSVSRSIGLRPSPPRTPKRRNSGNNPPLQVRTAKPKPPSLSHVINHINESPKPELKSFLCMDSAITPRASALPSCTSIAASTTSMYNIELPPFRMDGLMENRGEEDGYEPSPSSASSYTLTPTVTARTAVTTPSSASRLKVDDDDDLTTSTGSSRPSSRASSVASSELVLTPTWSSNTSSNTPWNLKSGWRDSVAVTRALDDLGQLHRALSEAEEEEEEEEEAFLDEVDQWLAYISKRIRQLEKRHKRHKSAGSRPAVEDVCLIRPKDERYSGVHHLH